MSENTREITGSRVVPSPVGGMIRTGGNPGNKGGTGRPKNEIREAARKDFEEAMPLIREAAMNLDHPNWKTAIDTLVKVSGLQQTDVTTGDQALQTVTVVFEAETPMATIDAILASE